MFYLKLGGVIPLLFSVMAYAQSPCEGQESFQQIVKCAEGRSPEVQSAILEMERAKANIGAATQWKNPEFAVESFHGKAGSQSRSETDVSLAVPVEPGKIGARRKVAESSVRVAEAVVLDARASVRTEIMLKLHRLRQLIHEEEIIDESIATFSKLVSQYAKRPKLSPEQQLSSTVFRLSKSDYEMRKANLSEELAALDSFFKLRVGLGLQALKNAVPPAPTKWPSVGAESDISRSPKLAVLGAELEVANAEVSLASRESWPTLSVGPSVKLLNEGGTEDRLYGFNLSLPIPVFNANGAGRAAARAGASLSEKRKDLGRQSEQNRRAELVRIYTQSVSTLNSTQSHPEIEKRHHESERLFLQGLVPSALVIEAHRSFVDLEQSRHLRELRAIEALFNIFTLDGQLPENSL
jgi:outer membrane protein TolC